MKKINVVLSDTSPGYDDLWLKIEDGKLKASCRGIKLGQSDNKNYITDIRIKTTPDGVLLSAQKEINGKWEDIKIE